MIFAFLDMVLHCLVGVLFSFGCIITGWQREKGNGEFGAWAVLSFLAMVGVFGSMKL